MTYIIRAYDGKIDLISKMFQPMTKVRHSGMDAGIQSQGCEAIYLAPRLNNAAVVSASYHPWHWIPASMPV